MNRWLAIAVAALLVACAQRDPEGASRSPVESEPILIPPTASESVKAGKATISGTFAVDSVEGGCPHLATAGGKRYEIRYPEGWSIERGTYRLLDPDGRVAARGGETITVRGHIADDMASTCQIGPIFVATEVVSIEG